jgi:mRNA interferase MazF
LEVRRGDFVKVVTPGSYGKPRPAVIIQSDLFNQHPSISVLPLSSELRNAPLFRVRIEPTAMNGLDTTLEVMVDKIQTIPIEKIGGEIGRASDEEMLAINRALAIFLGFA